MKNQIVKGFLVLVGVGFLSACANQNGQEQQGTETAQETFDTENRADSSVVGGEADRVVNGSGKYVWNQPPGEESGQSDDRLTQRIRQELVQDESLSTSAQNVQILTEDGKVTLRGTVDSIEEKNKVEQRARAAAGSVPLENQLQVTQ